MTLLHDVGAAGVTSAVATLQVRWRLFRESCCPYEGNYVKDLMALGRPLATTIIVDNRQARRTSLSVMSTAC